MTSFVDSPALRAAWYPVAESADVVDAPVAVRLLGEDFVLWRDVDGEFVVAPDRCPHREAPLSIGVVRDGVVSCAYHGWSFGAAGRCVAIPSSGPDAAIPPAATCPAGRVASATDSSGCVLVSRRATFRGSRRTRKWSIV